MKNNDLNCCVISFFYIKPQLEFHTILFKEVVLYLSSTSNHNAVSLLVNLYELCYIFLLHQTTTCRPCERTSYCCVISFFYIKPQHYPFPCLSNSGCVISFFYIKPQLFSLTVSKQSRCVISFFYIKPQQTMHVYVCASGCVISFFYIKPQPI